MSRAHRLRLEEKYSPSSQILFENEKPKYLASLASFYPAGVLNGGKEGTFQFNNKVVFTSKGEGGVVSFFFLSLCNGLSDWISMSNDK